MSGKGYVDILSVDLSTLLVQGESVVEQLRGAPAGASSTLAKTSRPLLAKTGHPPPARTKATSPQGGHGDDQEALLCLSALVRA